MSLNQKPNKFLKNETLFQTLYRINKQVKIPEKNNHGENISEKKIKNERVACENKYDRPDHYSNKKYNKSINKYENYNICNDISYSNPKNSKYTDISYSNPKYSKCCDICDATLYSDSRETKCTEDNNNNHDHKCCDICDETLYSDSRETKCTEDNNNIYDHDHNNNHKCCDICDETLYSNTEQNRSEINKCEQSESMTCESSVNKSSVNKSSVNKSSVNKSSMQETYEKNDKQSESTTYETPKISIKSENTSLSTKTYDDTYNDMSSAISDNYSREITNTDDHSILLIKIISNLEERLNSLETKKKKKNK
jgi:hypothetical protein